MVVGAWQGDSLHCERLREKEMGVEKERRVRENAHILESEVRLKSLTAFP